MQLILDIRDTVQDEVHRADGVASILYRRDEDLQQQLVTFAQTARPRRSKSEPPEFIASLASAVASQSPNLVLLVMPGLTESLSDNRSVGRVRAALGKLAADILIVTDLDPTSERANI